MPFEAAPAAQTSKRLHPLSPLFSIASAAWKLLLPGLLLLIFASREGNFEFWLVPFFVLVAIAAVANYLSFSYRLGVDELVIRKGILTRNERHIPYARIQNIDLVQNPFHRLFGVAEIKFETAGGDEPEANIQVLSLQAIEQMRARVFQEKRRVAEEARPLTREAQSAAAAAPFEQRPHTLLRLPLRDLALFGIISNRGMAIVAAAWGLAWQAQWQGWAPDWWEDWLNPEMFSRDVLEKWIAETDIAWASPLLTAGLVVGGLLVLLALLRLISIVWAIFKLYGFTLTRTGDDLRASYGLFTKLSATIPRHRIQLLTIHETLLHRWFGRLEIRAETAGGGKQNEDSGVSRKLLVPLLETNRLMRLLREVQPELDLETLEWQRVDPKAWRRILRKLLIALFLLTLIGTYFFRIWAWPALLVILPLSVLLAWLRYNRMAYALTPYAAIYRSGWWVRHLSIARFAKIQAVDMSQNPFDRRYRMATVRVDTAGAGHTGHRIRIPYLSFAIARRVYDRLGLEAAQTEFRW